MSEGNTLIIKNSAILFLRLLITSVIGLFTSRFIIMGLGASDFGLYSVVGSIVVLMAFLNAVMVTTTYRFLAFEMGKGSEEGLNKVFNISQVIHWSIAIILILLTESAGVYYVNNHLNIEAGKVKDALFVLRLSTYATTVSIISIPYMGLVTAKEKFSVQAVIEIIRSLLAFSIALIILHYAGNTLRLYAVLNAFVNAVPALLFFIYCKRKYHDIVRWRFQRDKGVYKEMMGFSGWIMIGAAAGVGKSTGSALIINAFFGTILNAAFGIATQVNNVITMFAMNLGQAAIPQITKSFSGGNMGRTISLSIYISKYTFFLMLIPSFPILLETEYMLTIWLGEAPPFTVVFCQLMIINALIESLGGVAAVVQATGKIKYFQIILSTTSLLSLPVAFALFKSGYPPPSIMLAFVITSIINLFLALLLLKRLIDFDLRFYLKSVHLRVLYVVSLIAPFFFIRDLFPSGLYRFILISVFALGGLFLAIYLKGIDTRERETLSQIIKSLVKW